MSKRSGHFPSHLDRIRQGVSPIEVTSIPHARWPLPPPSFPPHQSPHLNISILDSSFNPPTLAHLALANIPLSTAFPCTHNPPTPDCCNFHAKLFLLSVRNADKSLKPGDANYDQRMGMMARLAQDVKDDISPGHDDIPMANANEGRKRYDYYRGSNTAVALIDEPTFVGKARILLEFFHKILSSKIPSPDSAIDKSSNDNEASLDSDWRTIVPDLTFIVGIDTLERLFAPRYYLSEEDMHQRLSQFLSPDGDNCRVICARRVTPGVAEYEREREVIEAAKKFIDTNRIALVDIPVDVRMFSSSETRAAILADSPHWTTMVTPLIAEYITQQDLYSHWQSPH
ncbi:hypothetical protein QCA50_005619 [Cerrena zonata]|uniref:Nicotinamide-nucleotide adenylyltransferase n=1 Tax=Cerrena zonata TaxID=2478898 RepID=A0AAW0GC81_9APHY